MSRDRNYECKECGKEYSDYEIKNKRRGDGTQGFAARTSSEWVSVCPKGHIVKLIPRSKAPCPLCKESHWNRDVNKLCNSCQREIERLREFEKHNIAARGPMKLFWAASWPHFTYHGTMEDREILSRSFSKLLFLLGQKPPTNERGGRYGHPLLPSERKDKVSELAADKLLAFHPEVAQTIQEVFDATNRLTDANYRAGIEEGKNVIYQLATGGMSLKELQEHDIQHARQVQRKPKRRNK